MTLQLPSAFCYNVTMATRSTVDRLEIFMASAGLAAHASFFEEGFRQRDLKFFVELFLNWTEDVETATHSLQNTQLARFVSALTEAGFARTLTKKNTARFRLTRLGLLELLNRIVSSKNVFHPSTALFRICFIKSYRGRLEALVEREGSHFPHSLRIELTSLLDVDALIQHEIARVERAIRRIEQRIEDAVRTSALTKNRLAAGVPFSEVVREAETRYPYELNSMKPLAELIASIAPDQRQWELEHGNVMRAETIWKPQRALLETLLNQLRSMRRE